LMTIAPYSADAEKVRPVFRKLRELKSECEQVLGAPLPHLSMGMSGDFEVAIEEGATMVRIGTALFGPRGAARKAAVEARDESAD
jgi:PLP dependent protein